MKTRLLASFVVAALNSACIFSGGGGGDCDKYCDLMASNCDEVSFSAEDGDFDEDQCLAACALYPRVPVTGDDGAVLALGEPVPDKDSLECRTYHATNAAARPNGVHCTHAGVDGARTCVDFQEVCDEYCGGAKDGGVGAFEGVTEFCSADALGFSTASECGEFCNELLTGSPGDRTGNTRHCRLTYALEAFETQQRVTCSEAGARSTLCVDDLNDVIVPFPDSR